MRANSVLGAFTSKMAIKGISKAIIAQLDAN